MSLSACERKSVVYVDSRVTEVEGVADSGGIRFRNRSRV